MRISDWSSDVCSSDLHDGVDLTGADVEVEPVEDALAVDDGLEVGDVEHLAHRPFEAQAHERVGLDRVLHGELVEDLPAEPVDDRSEEHTSELQSLMSISYAVFCLKKKH